MELISWFYFSYDQEKSKRRDEKHNIAKHDWGVSI